MDSFSRFNRFWFVLVVFASLLFGSPVVASDFSYDPSHYEKIFGKPEDFVKKLENEMAPKLNEYLGLGISASGFILVIRALMR